MLHLHKRTFILESYRVSHFYNHICFYLCFCFQFPMGGPDGPMGPMGPGDMPSVMNGNLMSK